MKKIINFFRNLSVLSGMIYSARKGRALLKNYHAQTKKYYADGQSEQYLDIYKPHEATDSPLPVIIWFHGGGWEMGSRRSVESVIVSQLEKGFALVSVSYSLSKQAKWPTQCHEAKAAIRYLKANSDELGLDTSRFIVAGMSSGGHLACMLATTNNHLSLSGNLGDHGEVSSNVNAVIALYPPTDFLSMPKNFDGLIDYYSSDSPVAKLLGEPLSTAKDKAKLASPLQHVTNKCPPMLLLHGDKDPIVPVEQSKILHAALCNVGVDCQLHILSGYTHGDYRFNLGPGEKHIDDFLESYK